MNTHSCPECSSTALLELQETDSPDEVEALITCGCGYVGRSQTMLLEEGEPRWPARLKFEPEFRPIRKKRSVPVAV